MDYSLFYGIGGALIGVGVGWLIAGARLHQRHLAQEAERVSLAQGLQATRQALADEQHIRRQAELALREGEREQRGVFGRLGCRRGAVDLSCPFSPRVRATQSRVAGTARN